MIFEKGKLFVLIFIALVFISCCNPNKENQNTGVIWHGFVGKFPMTGEAEQLFLVHVNPTDSTFLLHWFMYGVNDNQKLFCRMSFHDKSNLEDDSTSLPSTLIFNELKMSNTQVMSFPLDQSPSFILNKQKDELQVFGKTLSLYKKFDDANVQKLISTHSQWAGQDLNILE